MPPPQSEPSKLLESDVEDDRRKGVLLLVRTRAPQARERLERIASQDPVPAIRYLARKALAFLDHGEDSFTLPAVSAPASKGRFVEYLKSPDPARRIEGVRLITRAGDGGKADLLLPLLARDADDAVRIAVLDYAAQFARASDLPRLLPLLRSPSAAVRSHLPPALVRAGGEKALPYLVYMLQDPDPDARHAARDQVLGSDRAQMLGALQWMLGQPETWMRDSAVYALSHVSDPEALPLLTQALADKSEIVRAKAQRRLERLGAMPPRDAGPGATPAPDRAASSAGGPAGSAASPSGAPNGSPPEAPAGAPSGAPVGSPSGAPPAGVAHTSGVQDAPRLSDAHSGPGGLGDSNPRVRLHVLEEAIHTKNTALLPTILDRLGIEDNVFVLSKLVLAAGSLGTPQTGKTLVRYLDHGDLRVVANAIEALAALGYREARARLKPMLAHKDSRIRANALMYFRDDPSVDKDAMLRKMLTAHGFGPKLSALHVLASHPPGDACGLVELVLGDINDDVREKAFGLLSTWSKAGNADAHAMLESCIDGDVAIKHESLALRKASPVRRMAAYALDLTMIVLVTLLVAGTVAAALPAVIGKVGFGVTLAAGTSLFFARDGFNAGRGLGKRIMRLRCVDITSNEGCSKAQSMIRQGFLGLGMAGPIELVFLHSDAAGRRMADWLVGTQVVDESDQALSGGEKVFGAFAYAFLGLSLIGSIRGMVTPHERVLRSARYGYSLTLPPGWVFTQREESHWEAMRRSWMRGEEVTVRMKVQPRLPASRLAGVPERASGTQSATDAEVLMRDGQKVRDSTASELSSEVPGIAVSHGPEGTDRIVAGQRVYSYDLYFDIHGHQGVARGVVLRKGELAVDFLATSPERSIFQARESELQGLLAAFELH